MKKILYTLMAVAVTATTMVSCNKHEVEPQVPAEGYRYTFSIVDDDTRATLDNQGVLWEQGDKVGMFLEGYTGDANLDVSTTPKSVVLYSREAIPAQSYAYAYYPYSDSNDDKEVTKIVLSNIQEGGANSAMPMAGIPFLVENEVPIPQGGSSASTNGQIKFLNLGSIIDFKVFSENYSDETVQYVQFQTNEGVVSGDFYLDLTAVNPADENTLAIECLSLGENEYDYVKVNQEVAVATDKASATSIYMVVAPGTYSGTITIGTDVATYTFPFTNKELARNVIKHYNMNLNNATRDEGFVEVVKTLPYTEAFTSNKGDFNINDVTLPDGVSSIWEFTSQYGAKVTSHFGEDDYAAESWLISPWIDLTDVVNAVVTFKHVSRFAGTVANEMTFWAISDDPDTQWTQLTIPTYSSGKDWDFVDSGEISLSAFVGKKVKVAFKYVGTSDKAGTWEIKNFSVNAAKGTPDLSFDPASVTVNVEGVDDFEAPVLNNPHGLSVSYTSDNEDVAEVDNSGIVTLTGESGTAIITATFAGNDNYEAGSASYTITVKGATVTDILDRAFTGVNAGANYTEWSGKTAMSGAVYAGQSAGYSGNSSDAIQLRSSNSNSGIVTTTSGGYAKKVTVSWNSNTQSGRQLDIYGKNSAYTKATDLYDDNEKGTLLGSIVNGTSTTLTIVGDYTFIGLRSSSGAMYLDEIQIEWSSTGSGVTPATYNVNIASDIQNGSVIASKIANIAENESVTLTVSANTGYELETLTVDGTDVTADVNGQGKYTFSMPSHNVEVNASFSLTQSGDENTTVTKTMNEIVSANNYTISSGNDVTCYPTFKLDDNVTVSTSGDPNCGSFWGTTTNDWRLYQNKDGDVTISVPSGKTLVSVKITYNVSNSGTLKSGNTSITSGSVQKVSGTSVTYTVGNTGSATNGQVRITALEVTYK